MHPKNSLVTVKVPSDHKYKLHNVMIEEPEFKIWVSLI